MEKQCKNTEIVCGSIFELNIYDNNIDTIETQLIGNKWKTY